MILFESDWVEKYPGAIIDTQTSNRSFVRLASLYRDMGIKNNSFLLALHNPELQHIDPFSENLGQEEMMMIGLEVSENPWYFFREICRVPMTGSIVPSKFLAHRGNIGLYWLFFNHVTTILEQIRQTGKSVGGDCLDIYLLNGGTNNTQINLITKDETLRTNNLARLKEIQSLLPAYLNMRRKDDIANTEMITMKEFKNEFKSHLPNKSPKAALNVGRGLTSPVFRIDEAAFIYNIGIILPAALSSGSAARDLAKLNHQPYGTVITTTAGKKDDPDGNYIYTMIQESAIFTEGLFDCKGEEDLHEVIRANSRKTANENISDYKGRGVIRCYMSFNHKQLGKTDEWLAQTLEDTNSKGEDADRDFFNIWTSGSVSSPFRVEDAQRIRKSQYNDVYQEITRPGAYIIRWFIPHNTINSFMNQNHCIMALDTSDASGGDDIGMVMRNITNGAVIAAGSYNRTNLITFSEWIIQLMIRFENITFIIERKSSGVTIIDYLLLKLPSLGIDPFKRLFNMVVQFGNENKEEYNRILKPLYARPSNIYTDNKKAFGFATSASGITSRSDLYSMTLLSAVRYTADTVHDKKTIDQLLSLVVKDGRVDHPKGAHDDQAICWVLSHWVMINGKQLDFYGINSSLILSQSTVRQNEVNTGSAYDKQYQTRIQQEIDLLIEMLKKEQDDFIALKYEGKLKRLYMQLSDTSSIPMSIDDMIKQINKDRGTRQRMRTLH